MTDTSISWLHLIAMSADLPHVTASISTQSYGNSGLGAAGGDVPVGGGGANVQFGGAIVLEGVADAAVACAGVQYRRDTGGGGDRNVAGLGAEYDRAAHGLGDPACATRRCRVRGSGTRPGSANPLGRRLCLHVAGD